MARRKKKSSQKPDLGPESSTESDSAHFEKPPGPLVFPEGRAGAFTWAKTNNVRFKSQTSETLATSAALLLIAIVYLYTMWPTVAGGDSGELIAAVYSLGVIHPPGYPLYTLLAHLFSQMPLGSVGWRVNFFSLICGLGTFVLFLLICRYFVRHFFVALAAGLSLMFSALMWRYSIVAEVFTFHALLSLSTIYLTLRAVQESKPQLAIWVGLLIGLGVSHHHTFIFVAMGCCLFLIWNSRLPSSRMAIFRPRILLTSLIMMFLGLTPYLYLVWASHQVPLIAWGDQTTWDGFWTHFFRREYGTFQLASDGTQSFQLFWGLYYYLLSLAQHLGYLGLGAFGFAIYKVSQKSSPLRPYAILVLGISTFYLVVFHSLANLPFVDGAAIYKDIVARFWLMPHVLLYTLFAYGLSEVLDALTARQYGSPKTWQMAFFVLPLGLLVTNFPNENHHDDHVFADFGKRMLAPVPPNAVFFSLGDINTNTIRYLQICENHRPDVRVIDRSLMSYAWFKRIDQKYFPDVTLPGTHYHPKAPRAYDFKRLFDANYNKHIIFMNLVKTKGSNEAFDHAWEKDYVLVPFALSYRLLKISELYPIDSYIEESQKYLVDPLDLFPKEPLIDSWDAVVQANYWLAHHLRAAEILKYGLKSQERKYLDLSVRLLEDLVIRNQHASADYFKNLGVAHQHLIKFTSGEERAQHERRMLEVWETFLQKTDRKDKTTEDIRTVLRAYGR